MHGGVVHLREVVEAETAERRLLWTPFTGRLLHGHPDQTT
jgi:dihydroorotase-like cyclic amidohydrolase